MLHPRSNLVTASLLALICLLLGGAAHAETFTGKWRFTGFTFQGVKPSGAGVWQLKTHSNTNAFLDFSPSVFTNNSIASFSVPNSVSGNNATCDWAYISIGYTMGGVYKPVMWCQCRPSDGRPAYDPPRNGPYDESGQREDAFGNPVNDLGEGVPEPEPDGMYTYEINYPNHTKHVYHVDYTVQEGPTGAGEIIMIGVSGAIQPGTVYHRTFRYAHPFGVLWQAYRESDGEREDPPVTGIADETDDTPPEAGEPGGPGGPIDPGADVTTPMDQQVAKPDPIVPVARPDTPGAGEGNTEARHGESLQGLGRVVDAVNDAANQAAGDADLTNDYLAKIGNKLDDLAEAEGGGGTSNAPAVPTPPAAESENATGIVDAIGGLLTALGQLQQSVQIGYAGGQAMRFDITVFDVPVAFNLEPYNDTFMMIREALLWLFRLMFAFKSVQVIRGAFA